MCYESLTDGTATERPLSVLLGAETRAAVGNGLAAAIIVVAVLFARGAGPAATLGAAIGALVLGTMLHQAVLVVAVAAQRVWSRSVTTLASTSLFGPSA